jgi:hypothetical protein
MRMAATKGSCLILTRVHFLAEPPGSTVQEDAVAQRVEGRAGLRREPAEVEGAQGLLRRQPGLVQEPLP